MDNQNNVESLQQNWVWVPDWEDRSVDGSGGRLVTFSRTLELDEVPDNAVIHCTADTRYKLLINGTRVALGPARSSPQLWAYDTIDVAPYLKAGNNEIVFNVLRFFSNVRSGLPFMRTAYPGLTAIGTIANQPIDTATGWTARVNENLSFPTGLIDDVFLHINERITSPRSSKTVIPVPYSVKTVNGELAPWHLQPRGIPLPEETPVNVLKVHKGSKGLDWLSFFQRKRSLDLPAQSTHTVDVSFVTHATAFTRWTFRSATPTQIKLKVTFSEGYEFDPRQYPFLRNKGDRLDDQRGQILGPFDEVVLNVTSEDTKFEPFWFRTFRLLRVEMTMASEPVTLVSFEAAQTNYPLAIKGKWAEPADRYNDDIWEVSIRTLRNCMFDGYSDCPFYEQLQYSGDGRSVSLFHYLISGDDRLSRRAITYFASSITSEGLTQSRYPSQVPQVIAGFPLFWILQVYDHFLYFGDRSFTRSLLPLVDGILNFYDRHVDELGLVSGLPPHIWQYVDWVDGWHATPDHPDKGVPTAGRKSNRHTFFSMLYSWTLQHAARLLRQVGRPALSEEYEQRSKALNKAILTHCYDGTFFTDSTADIKERYSQHCQIFAVLCGAADSLDKVDLLRRAFSSDLGKCSYVMMFYAFRAFAKAGTAFYCEMYPSAWDPWRRMIDNNLTTWEEDDVRQRSDCHAWGSVPIYEYCVEVAGVRPIEPGCRKIEFAPKPSLSDGFQAKVALGTDNVATVIKVGDRVELILEKPIEVVSIDPKGERTEHGVVDSVTLS